MYAYSFIAMKKRKQTVVTGDLKPMTDTLNQVIQDEIKPKLNITTISQKSERKVRILYSPIFPFYIILHPWFKSK